VEQNEMINCNVVRDLLPLYVDDVLTPDSAAIVETHLSQCPPCASELEALRKLVPEKKKSAHVLLKKSKRKLKRIIALVVAACLLLTVGGIAWSQPLVLGYHERYFDERALEYCVGEDGEMLRFHVGTNRRFAPNFGPHMRMMGDIIEEDGKQLYVVYITWWQSGLYAFLSRIFNVRLETNPQGEGWQGDEIMLLPLETSYANGSVNLAGHKKVNRVYYYPHQGTFGGGDNENGWSQRMAILERSHLIWDAETAGEPMPSTRRGTPWIATEDSAALALPYPETQASS
jgi:hypothetical protein